MLDTKPNILQMSGGLGDPSGGGIGLSGNIHHQGGHHPSMQQQMGAAAAAAAAAAANYMPYTWQYAATMNQGLLT